MLSAHSKHRKATYTNLPLARPSYRLGLVSTAPLIHVVDDDEPLRIALLRLLTAAGFEARGYGSTGEFLLHPPLDRPGCVLLDVRLPGPSGLDLQDAMRDHGIDLPIIFLTAHADVSSSVRAMKSGAVDFLEKPVGRDTLLGALARALARDLDGRNQRNHSHQLRARFELLAPRERDVFDRVVAGKANKIIADEIGIAERTVKFHRARLMAKLGVASSAELGVLAEQLRRLVD
jgi:FixJ family two-component response regulator